jgi:GNAT superfamily N-acetyltransferase
MQKYPTNRCIVCWGSGGKADHPDALNIHEIFPASSIVLSHCRKIMPNMRYKIRRVDLSCLDTQLALTRLQKQCLPYDDPFSTTSGYWWLAYSETGALAGFAGLVPSLRWSDCGYLCRAGVLPSHRGQGLQKKLIKARIRQAKKLGMNWLVTDTYDNPPSANSLISTGFQMFNPTKPWGGQGVLYWRKKL